MSLLDELTIDDLDEEQRELADCIGFEAYRRLLSNYAGDTIRVRMPNRITLPLRNEKIKEDFTGYNYRELAKKYGMHPYSIWRIVADIRIQKQNEPLPEQIDFNDLL